MSKILTDELIKETLIYRGWQDINDADQDWQRKMVLEHYDVELTDRFDNNCGYYIYTESTRDGYEVWVATESMGNVLPGGPIKRKARVTRQYWEQLQMQDPETRNENNNDQAHFDPRPKNDVTRHGGKIGQSPSRISLR